MKIPKVLTHILESNTRIIPILGVLLLAIAVPITLNLIEQNQDNRQQAAQPPVSIQEDPAVGVPESCADLGGQCIEEATYLSDRNSCFAGNVNGDYTCATGSICCIQIDDDARNQTCEGPGKTCDYNSVQACESALGTGNCTLDQNSDCFNHNLCFDITNSSTVPSPSPSQTQSQFPPLGAPCEDGSGNYSCGFGTPDTQCPVCSPVATCSTDNYSIARCSGAAVCTEDADCANNPPSCPAGKTGQVVCQKSPGQSQGTCATVSCQ